MPPPRRPAAPKGANSGRDTPFKTVCMTKLGKANRGCEPGLVFYAAGRAGKAGSRRAAGPAGLSVKRVLKIPALGQPAACRTAPAGEAAATENTGTASEKPRNGRVPSGVSG